MPDIFRHKTERCNVMCHNLEETLVGLCEFHYVPFVLFFYGVINKICIWCSQLLFFKNVIPLSTILHTISNFATHTSIDDAGLCGLVTGLIAFLIGVDPFCFFCTNTFRECFWCVSFQTRKHTSSQRAGKNWGSIFLFNLWSNCIRCVKTLHFLRFRKQISWKNAVSTLTLILFLHHGT